jgi:hypothetical protein
MAQHSALRLVSGTDDRGQFGRWREDINAREAHIVRVKVALGEMCAADFVAVGLGGAVLLGSQHGQHVELSRQLEQVVIVSRVTANRLPVTLQQFHLSVDSEHFLDERPPEMQQPEWESYLILRPETNLSPPGTDRDKTVAQPLSSILTPEVEVTIEVYIIKRKSR